MVFGVPSRRRPQRFSNLLSSVLAIVASVIILFLVVRWAVNYEYPG